VTTYEIDEPMGFACMQFTTAQIAINGFQETGIYGTRVCSTIKNL
jgi:hypothetical protein